MLEHWSLLRITLISDVEKERSALENVPPTLYDTMCVPDLGDFLPVYNYQSTALTPAPRNEDHKPPTATTPASAPHSPQPPTSVASNNNFIHDGK